MRIDIDGYVQSCAEILNERESADGEVLWTTEEREGLAAILRSAEMRMALGTVFQEVNGLLNQLSVQELANPEGVAGAIQLQSRIVGTRRAVAVLFDLANEGSEGPSLNLIEGAEAP